MDDDIESGEEIADHHGGNEMRRLVRVAAEAALIGALGKL